MNGTNEGIRREMRSRRTRWRITVGFVILLGSTPLWLLAWWIARHK